MSDRIDPRVLKGFRDFLPEEELERRRVLGILESSFRSFGFVPIDTPILEYTEILLGKAGGETEKQVYRFEDHGGRDVAMRFDLTVPFARFLAQHRNDLALPFKRYHIAKVFRGENTQRGRYREFMQCDFDIVGTDSASADLEIIFMIVRSLEALGLSAFHVRISNRAIFNRFLDHLGMAGHSEEILRTVDKLRKIGTEKTRHILAELTGAEAAADILAFVAGAREGERYGGGATDTAAGTPATRNAARNAAVLENLTVLAGGPADDTVRVAQILEHAETIGVGDRIVLDPSITRGLDYYPGMVFETFLDTEESIGSVCSGGRYNDLASLYTREQLPGVGASIGVDRLLAAVSDSRAAVPSADAIVLYMDDSLVGRYHAIADALRRAGLRCEV
ncbi:MAG: histidine--tRNA ligase, partial [Spirochaetota bacterium]